MIILSIETSCDETSVAIIKSHRSKQARFEVLSHKVLSQIDLHKQYGGVFPAMAKREHARTLTQLIAECLDEANLLVERKNEYFLEMSKKKKLESLLSHEQDMHKALLVLFQGIQKPKIDAIAVTSGPGLEPALWVGINSALSMNLIWNIPVYPINHMEGHIITSLFNKEKDIYTISPLNTPSIALLISGGHTEIVRISKLRKYKVIGKTKDDAVGEVFDKVARMLELPYPGGPEISKLADIARKENIMIPDDLKLPRPMIHSKDLYFSFSGLKTAVMTRLKKYNQLNDEIKKVIALEFENSVTDVIVTKVKQAIYENGAKSLIVGGGVSANTNIRENLKELALEENIDLYLPDTKLSGDNALMIAGTCLIHIENKGKPKKKIIASGSWSVENS